jgi:hypothetical protein
MIVQQLKIREMIDWYDGIVLAIVTKDWNEDTYLCSLLAFDADLKKRVFALLPLDDSDVSEIRSRLGGEWEILLSYLKHLWDKASGNVTLLCYSDIDERMIAEKTIEANKVRTDAIADIEEAVSNNRRSWFSLF